MGRFELYRDPQNGFRWRLKGADGLVLATSAQSHPTLGAVHDDIDRVKRAASDAVTDDQTTTTF